MAQENSHHASVDAFMRRAAAGSSGELIASFEAAASAMWQRAHRTLGDVTLTAIFNRVLYTAAEQYPFLGSLNVDANGVNCKELHKQGDSLDPVQLVEGIRLLLEEFLSVLGNLTAEILTPALHFELANVGEADTGPSEHEPAGPAAHRDGEDTNL